MHISYIFLHLPSFTFVDIFDLILSQVVKSAWNQQIEVHQIHLDGALSPKQRLTRLQRGDHPTDVIIFTIFVGQLFNLLPWDPFRSTLIRKELSCEPERYTLKQRMTSSGMMERLMDRDPAGSLLFERPSHFGFCGDVGEASNISWQRVRKPTIDLPEGLTKRLRGIKCRTAW